MKNIDWGYLPDIKKEIILEKIRAENIVNFAGNNPEIDEFFEDKDGDIYFPYSWKTKKYGEFDSEMQSINFAEIITKSELENLTLAN